MVAQWAGRSAGRRTGRCPRQGLRESLRAGRCPLYGLQVSRRAGRYPLQGLQEGLLRGVYGGIRPIAPIRSITPTTCPVLARVGVGLISLIGAIGLISPIKVAELNGG